MSGLGINNVLGYAISRQNIGFAIMDILREKYGDQLKEGMNSIVIPDTLAGTVKLTRKVDKEGREFISVKPVYTETDKQQFTIFTGESSTTPMVNKTVAKEDRAEKRGNRGGRGNRTERRGDRSDRKERDEKHEK